VTVTTEKTIPAVARQRRRKMIDLETTCSFCPDEASTHYKQVYFCSRHLVIFWLGLKYTGWDI